jgi:hypothetical protein
VCMSLNFSDHLFSLLLNDGYSLMLGVTGFHERRSGSFLAYCELSSLLVISSLSK